MTSSETTYKIRNNQSVPLDRIPTYDYSEFRVLMIDLLKNGENHCVNYFAYQCNNRLQFIACVASDSKAIIHLLAHEMDLSATVALQSLTADIPALHLFEREIHENFGIAFTAHPWLKPVRFAHNRKNKTAINDYPFYSIKSEELHEVGVGPIHAGIIEPGHFRFICNGENVLHLEIQLGWQHRGIEELFVQKKKILERSTLAENIAGDTCIGHSTAFVNLWEGLCNYVPDESLEFARTIASELERIAIHTGDLSAICADIAYQLGNAVFGRLRTPIVNFFQEWGGNRLAKGLIRAGKINYPFTPELATRLLEILKVYEIDFDEISAKLFNLPSALNRMENIGEISPKEAYIIGTVGMVARTSGLNRDIRSSHPYNLYQKMDHQPIIKQTGDVHARAELRVDEIKQSIAYLRQLLNKVPASKQPEDHQFVSPANSFAISLTEGWRGEICHCAITDDKGELLAYKIKDPSHHNWMALAQVVRKNEISDFPICNKSFNLSYCGHDL
ncbi:hydrogenase large subunit [Ancylomarina longa]|uniref:NADH dehydrogenase subunit n=1 Tax=Ancylomarina longa TaxID=2487017 RepID=A0A434AYY1_9BACT|nr:NADH-quinone oxidoreductase subunit C [Ancylomarina longa]RUT79831.1 NADH dehydrogenase subunit [Ancylomarina longa]